MYREHPAPGQSFRDGPGHQRSQHPAAHEQAADHSDVPGARLAADQFIALPFGVALSRYGSAHAAEDTLVRPLLVEGVRTYLRAYRAG
ncbi:hypothetical protein ACWCQ0_26085 [Streptomyces massasporeus]|uniref:Tetracyclin repressor-like C-terminal domain-containing protein n=1 Tax=Streptomyces massasporeus TaxID=67324 RepID=A0ABW6LQV5_9ACTN